VQGAILDAARRFLGDDARVTGASRTDAGVHALRQTASLTISATLAPTAVQAALNAALPGSVRVLDARDAPPRFDARRAAAGKRYLYLIDNGAIADPLWRRFAWHVPGSLDLDAMRRHWDAYGFRWAFRRDLTRLRRNWKRAEPAFEQMRVLIGEISTSHQSTQDHL